MGPQHELSSSASYQPAAGPPGSGQPFTYAVDSPDLAQPPSAAASYYTKYSSVKQTSTTSTNNSAVSSSRGGQLPDRSAVPFPHQQARSPTPQSPPKRVEELMSEFRDFDSAHGGGGSPTPPMFTHARAPANTTNTVVVTELPDEVDEEAAQPSDRSRQQHSAASQRLRDDASPPRGLPKAASGTKGPDVYYPPGADFGKTAAAQPRPAGDGGSLSLEKQSSGGGAKGMKQARAARGGDRYGGSDGADKQGAAVIPICLPLCCAAPCVIM